LFHTLIKWHATGALVTGINMSRTLNGMWLYHFAATDANPSSVVSFSQAECRINIATHRLGFQFTFTHL